MDRELINLRRELTHIERGRDRRYPAALRDRIARWTRARRGGGARWQDIAGELEIAIETIKRWTAIGDAAETALVPVEVTDVPPVGHRDREFRLVTGAGSGSRGFVSPT
jgi:hypothetical protein